MAIRIAQIMRVAEYVPINTTKVTLEQLSSERSLRISITKLNDTTALSPQGSSP